MFFYKISTKMTKVLFNTMYRVKVEGISNLPEKEGYMVCANHIHAFDPVLISSFLKPQISHMAKKELFRIPGLNILLRCSGAFPIDRGNLDYNGIKKAISILKNKKVLSIFPEGTRHRDGIFRDIKKGPATIAIQTNSNIVPMRIVGNYKPFSRITIKIGEPISSIGCTVEELTEKLKLAIEKLAPIPA